MTAIFRGFLGFFHSLPFRSLFCSTSLSLAATCGGTVVAHAANFTASTQAELANAITQANASSDASSTITLTGNFTIATNSLPAITSNIRVDVGGHILTSAGNLTFNVTTGNELVVTGAVATTGSSGFSGSIIKSGEGTLIFSGGSGTVTWHIGTVAGDLILKDGATFTHDDAPIGSLPLAGKDTIVTISGAGTVLNSKRTLRVEGTLNIEKGGAFSSLSYAVPASDTDDRATINVTGTGSKFEGGGVRIQKGYAAINVLDGGSLSGDFMQIGVVASVNAAGTGLPVGGDQGGSGDIVVSDTGSTMTIDNPFLMARGSLSILNGGVVTAGAMRVGSFDRAVTKDAIATIVVSGQGSQLSTTQNNANAFIIGGGAGAGIKNGTLTVANDGKVVAASGPGTINVATTAGSSGTINIGGEAGQVAVKAGTIEAAAIQFGAGTGALNFNHSDESYDFALAVNGNGTISQTGSGKTILSTDQSGFTGETVVHSGTLAVNNVLGGTVQVIGGRLQGIGTIGDTLNEAGGIIAPGNSIGTLTIDGNYHGNGGVLEIEAALGDDNSAADMLVITGDATGNTDVVVINDNGAGAPTVNGIRIIEVGGTSNADAFALRSSYEIEGQKVVVVGAYAYALYQGGVSTPTDGDWYLRSALAPKDPEPENPGNNPGTPPDSSDPDTNPHTNPGTDPSTGPGTQPGGGSETGGENPKPVYQAGVPVYEAYAQSLLSANGLPTLQQRVGNRYWSEQNADANSGNKSANIWGRIEGSHSRYEPQTSKTLDHYDADIWKMQAGIDGQFIENENGKLIGGLTVQYARISTDASSFYGNGKIDTNGYGVGGTLTWYGSNGFYLDAQAQATWYRSDLSSANANSGLTDGNKGFGYALSAETGQRFALSDRWSLTPQAQLAYSSIDLDGFKDGFGSLVSFDRADSLQGRIGLSADYQTSHTGNDGKAVRTHAYGIANLYQEFLDGSRVKVSGVNFDTRNQRTWGGLGAGGTHSWADGKYSLYGEVSVNTSLQDFADSYSMNGTVGFKVAF